MHSPHQVNPAMLEQLELLERLKRLESLESLVHRKIQGRGLHIREDICNGDYVR